MVYEHLKSDISVEKLFKNPTAEYRGAPFWAWNCKLDKDELLSQIDILKKMGFGGFFMHSRSGMATEYLGKEFMEVVSACVEKAKKENLSAWLYDEDRWPSGYAGGLVTKNRKFRQRYLCFTRTKKNVLPFKEAYEKGETYLLACYDVILNDNGHLSDYCRIEENDTATGKKWYAYIKTSDETGWYNNQTYADTFSSEAMDEFIKITYEAYEKSVGGEFGKTVNAFFTDEPSCAQKKVLAFAKSEEDAYFPWTIDFPDTFKKQYGFDIIECLPEIIWDLPVGQGARVRYCFHDHCCERFASAFADRLGKWCSEHNLELTGHLLGERSLQSQGRICGEVMRSYRSFGIPGIDMLCDFREYITAKQAQSAKNQYGREAMLSELYGVTGWHIDFRGYKSAGDWQAALGVTLRVPHLSWVSMKGVAKRDYPATFNYQAPWHEEYSVVEDHFARIGTILTRGKPVVNVAVLHPIESAWVCYGPAESSGDALNDIDECFDRLTQWLLFGTVDFDYVCEALLPGQYSETKEGLKVGVMNYSAVIIPPIKTIRSTTITILNDFINRGGKVVFTGECPQLVDGEESGAAFELYHKSKHVSFTKAAVLESVNDLRELEIRKISGLLADNYLYNLRDDGEMKYLFIANGKTELTNDPQRLPARDVYKDTVRKEDVVIKIKGSFAVRIMDTMNGEINDTEYTTENGYTIVPFSFYAHDSLLLELKHSNNTSCVKSKYNQKNVIGKIDLKSRAGYILEEPNVYLMDMAEYSLDGGELHGEEEILRIDEAVREVLKIQKANGCDAQPWVLKTMPPENFVTLKFNVQSEIDCYAELAYEEMTQLCFNGKPLEIHSNGYFVDKSIHKMKLPMIKKGSNTLVITAPVSERVSLENYFLIGDFGVKVNGCEKIICAKEETVPFGSITHFGMPFYGGNITYISEFEAPSNCTLKISTAVYRGAMVKVFIDGKACGNITVMPYSLLVPQVTKGKHKIEFKLYGNRHNTFGALHNRSDSRWYGPGYWYSEGSDFSYEYNLRDAGILVAPNIEFIVQ